MLPIVIYNGCPPWTVAGDVADLIATGGEALAQYQPALRYFLFDEGRVGGDDLPRRNLVSALIALETNRERERVPELVSGLIERLRELGDEGLTRAFGDWVEQILVPRRYRGAEKESLLRLEEVRTMLAEQVQEWNAELIKKGREQGLKEGIEQGIERGIERGRAEERALLCRLAARKFDAEAAQRLSAVLLRVVDPDRLAQVGDWIIECATEAELLDRVLDANP